MHILSYVCPIRCLCDTRTVLYWSIVLNQTNPSIKNRMFNVFDVIVVRTFTHYCDGFFFLSTIHILLVWCGVVKKRNHCSFDSFIFFFFAIIIIKRYYKFIYDKYSLNLFMLEMVDVNAGICILHRHSAIIVLLASPRWEYVFIYFFLNSSEAIAITVMQFNLFFFFVFFYLFYMLHQPNYNRLISKYYDK